jgi:hypothetical protein
MSIKSALHDVLTGVIYTYYTHVADRSGCAVQGVGLRTIACCDCRYESRRVHGSLSLVSVVCCQVSLRGADHSSRGALPSVVCLSVIVSLVEKVLTHQGLLSHEKNLTMSRGVMR